MSEDRFSNIEIEDDIKVKEEIKEGGSSDLQNLLSSDFLLLILIIFIFFWNTDTFSGHFQLINDKVKTVKGYLDMADATIQALDQATQIPKQML